MDATEIEETCLEVFLTRDYVKCAKEVMRLSNSQNCTTGFLLQLNLICFQRIDYPGADEMGEMAIRVLGPDPWAKALIKLTLGDKVIDEVLALAVNDTMRCQAYYYEGARILTRLLATDETGEATGAAVHEACDAFRESLKTGASCTEYELARIEADGLGCPSIPNASPLDELIDEEFSLD